MLRDVAGIWGDLVDARRPTSRSPPGSAVRTSTRSTPAPRSCDRCGRRPRRRSTSCTCCCRTSPGTTSPPGRTPPRTRRCRPASSTACGRTTTPRRSAASGTSSRRWRRQSRRQDPRPPACHRRLDDTMRRRHRRPRRRVRRRPAFRGVAPSTYPSIMWTPLLVKSPASGAPSWTTGRWNRSTCSRRSPRHLGVRMPWRIDGRSVVSAPAHRRAAADVRVVAQRGRTRARSSTCASTARAGSGPCCARRAAAGPASDPLRVFRIGPYAGLVGAAAYPLARLGHPSPTPRSTARCATCW